MAKQSQLNRALDAVLAVAPELANQRPYIAVNDPDALGIPMGGALAVATTRCRMTEHHLRLTSQWRGPAPIILFSADHPADDHLILGTMTHECAHLLPAVQLTQTEAPTTATMRRERALLERFAAEPIAPGAEPWHGHGATFIRIVCHLHYRLLWSGQPLPLELLRIAGARYHLSPAFKYYEAISGELFRLRRHTFAEIAATDPPAEFASLFAADVARWRDNQVKLTPADVAA